jgi:hypothetical protein
MTHLADLLDAARERPLTTTERDELRDALRATTTILKPLAALKALLAANVYGDPHEWNALVFAAMQSVEAAEAQQAGQGAGSATPELVNTSRAPGRWQCPSCGGSNVQISLPTWYRETRGGELELVEADSEAHILWYYCDDCDDSESGQPIDRDARLVELVEIRARPVELHDSQDDAEQRFVAADDCDPDADDDHG